MPLIRLEKCEYEHTPSGYRKIPKNLGLIPSVYFWETLQIKKARIEFTCCACAKKKKKGTRYIGDSWSKICHNCLEEYPEKSKNTMGGMIHILEKIKKQVSVNKEKWDKEVLVNSLGG